MFDFSSDYDKDTFLTLSGLVKKNDGLFKSAKQAQFLGKRYRAHTADSVKRYSAEEINRAHLANYGVDLDAASGQYAVHANGFMRWADYGSDSYRPVCWIFVMDDHGVVAQYKLAFVGTMRKGTSVDPEKTKLLWKREVTPTPFVEEVKVEEAKPESFHIGSVGERMTFKGIVKSIISFDRPKFHYYDSGVGHITRVIVNGSTVVYFGALGEEGQEIEFKATVKEHGEFKGVKQTVVARPKLLTAVE